MQRGLLEVVPLRAGVVALFVAVAACGGDDADVFTAETGNTPEGAVNAGVSTPGAPSSPPSGGEGGNAGATGNPDEGASTNIGTGEGTGGGIPGAAGLGATGTGEAVPPGGGTSTGGADEGATTGVGTGTGTGGGVPGGTGLGGNGTGASQGGSGTGDAGAIVIEVQ